MKQILSIIILFISYGLSFGADLTFEGTYARVVKVPAAASTGLEAVYVIENADGVTLSYPGAANVKWSRFTSSGAAYAEPVATSTSIAIENKDCGYIAEYDGRSHYFWIVNYANHEFQLTDFQYDSENSDCTRTAFRFTGSAAPITFYSINGRPETLDREISVSYTTLEYNSDAAAYNQVKRQTSFQSLNQIVSVESSLCSTRYTISGDRFLKEWNKPVTFETSDIRPLAVSAETSAVQTERNIDNEQRVIGASLGGSAPCEITFSASVTDGASFYEWQLSHNSDFDPIDDRYPQLDLTFTFRDQGTTYVRYFAANDDGSCEFISSSYEVSIGESSLLCPNAFSPQSTPGVNDEWKVSYKSLISFDCHIFNRWGIEVCSFTDPSMGWDGKYKGKYVPAGTYYYVIKARGADGREYKLSGDINIINSKASKYSGESAE